MRTLEALNLTDVSPLWQGVGSEALIFVAGSTVGAVAVILGGALALVLNAGRRRRRRR